MEQRKKMIIYQVLPRLFGNQNDSLVYNGSLEENGVGKFSSFTPEALAKIREMGTTHIWYTGIIEHATQTDYSAYGIPRDHVAIVKGKAGSPYAIKDYYDVDPDLADKVPDRMAEFEELIRRTHKAGMKVIIDFVPNHVARQYHSDVCLSYIENLGEHDDISKAFDVDNNFYYIPGHPLTLSFGIPQDGINYSEFPAKVTGNNRFDACPGVNDWYETVKLNYGIDYENGSQTYFDPPPGTWHKMLQILRFWSSKGVDGFRCDMAEMVPVQFWNWVIPQLKQEYPVCFIAEVYNPAEYMSYIFDGHFDYLYDKVGLYDTVRNVIGGHCPASEITRCWQALEGIQHRMLNFLENHDEQRIASDFFAGNPQAGIPGMIVSALMNVNPVMIYNGQELGERGMDHEGFSGPDGRTTIFDYWSMELVRNWINGGTFDDSLLTDEQKTLRQTYADLLKIARDEQAIVLGSFHDLMYANAENPAFDMNRQYAFLRKFRNEVILVVANFSGEEKNNQIRIPENAFDVMEIGDNLPAMVTDLFTGEQHIATLTAACPYHLTVPAYGGKILKFIY